MITATKFNIDSSNSYRFVHLASDPAESNSGKNYKRPPLVLLHGMFGGVSNYDFIAEKCTKTGYEVWIPELPLCDAPKNVTVQFLGDWLHDFMQYQEIKNPILVGNSMGGHLALDAYLRKRCKAKAMILTGSSGLFEEQFGESTPKRRNREYIRQRIELTFEHFEVTEEMVDSVMAILRDRKKLIHMVSLARSTHKYNLRNQLGSVDCPVLLIWGRQDKITPPEVAIEFQELIPDATLRWIDNCGHAPMMEHPNRFFAELKPFIDRLDQSQDILDNKPKTQESTVI